MGERYDAAIVGTGPAGLSAAITLKIRNKKIILLGKKELSVKVEKAHEVKNYLGIPSVTGEELAKKFADHLGQMGIGITGESITAVYGMGEYYSLLSKTNQIYEASAVILATGISFDKPYPGEEQYLGRGVSYCATCDAPLYKDKVAVIIGQSPKEEPEADFMSEIAKKVYYIPLYQEEVNVRDCISVIRDVPVAIEGGLKAGKLVLKGREIEADGIFILRETVSSAQLVPGLKMNGSHVEVNRRMETNLKGCFACGDITGTPYQYIKAAGEGNVAAITAAGYLDNLIRGKEKRITCKNQEEKE